MPAIYLTVYTWMFHWFDPINVICINSGLPSFNLAFSFWIAWTLSSNFFLNGHVFKLTRKNEKKGHIILDVSFILSVIKSCTRQLHNSERTVQWLNFCIATVETLPSCVYSTCWTHNLKLMVFLVSWQQLQTATTWSPVKPELREASEY